MDELEKAIAIISAASGAEATVVAERLKSDDAAQLIATEYFEPKYKEQRDQGHKTATMKERKAAEKAFKDAGIEDVSAENLPAAIAALQTKASAGSIKDMSDEEVLRLQPVVKALNTLKQGQEQAIEAARAEERTKLADREKAFTKGQTDAAVRKEAERLVTELDPNFSADPARAARQRQKLIDDLIAQGGYQLGQSGSIELVDEHGNLLDGPLGKPAQFAERVRGVADELYGLPEAKKRDAPSSGTPAATADVIKTKEEYDAAYIKNQANSAELDKLEATYPQFAKP